MDIRPTVTVRNIQALRGVACLMVIAFHLAEYEHGLGIGFNVLSPFLRFGFSGVDLFFVISGFIIAVSQDRTDFGPAKSATFLARRIWRVLPPYWIWLLLVAVPLYAAVGLPPSVVDESLLPAIILDPTHTNHWIGPAWTLAYELSFYISFALILLLPHRVQTLALITAGLTVVTAQFIRNPSIPSWTNLVLGPFVLEFLAGIVIASVRHLIGTRTLIAAITIGSVWMTIGLVLLGQGDAMRMIGNPLTRVLIFGGPAACLVIAAVAAERTGRVISWAWLLACGNASYSIYLTHSIVLFLSWRATMNLQWSHARPFHIAWIVAILTYVMTIGFGFHHLVERPLLALGKRKRALNATTATSDTPLRQAA